MEINDAIKIKDDLTVEDDGFEIDFTPEESEKIRKEAKEKGMSPQALIKKTINKAHSQIEKKIGEIKEE